MLVVVRTNNKIISMKSRGNFFRADTKRKTNEPKIFKNTYAAATQHTHVYLKSIIYNSETCVYSTHTHTQAYVRVCIKEKKVRGGNFCAPHQVYKLAT